MATYYAQNYASIICQYLLRVTTNFVMKYHFRYTKTDLVSDQMEPPSLAKHYEGCCYGSRALA